MRSSGFRSSREIDFEAFQADPKTIAAVERKLQIVSEAAIRLGLEAEQRCPGLPWADIRGIGNWLRHRYDRVELDIVWTTVTVNLPELLECVKRVLGSASEFDRAPE